jgi:hypothetical protein
MKTTISGLLALGTLAASGAYAANGSGCDAQLSAALDQAQHIVGSLHPDKPSQMRVFANDGSEFTAGQAQWMKGQLRRVSGACTQGDAGDAKARLAQVQELLSEHHRAS